MKVKFWGARGSIPTPASPAAIEDKIRRALAAAVGLDLSTPQGIEECLRRLPAEVSHPIGGNTACIEVRADGQLLILDAGSGLRALGLDLMRSEFGEGRGTADFLISHTHWDHIQGLPFFQPGFVAGNRLTFYSPHGHLQAALAGQQEDNYFPVPLTYLRADIRFERIPAQTWSQLGRLRVYPLQVSHPGENYCYRIEFGQTSLVYATDTAYILSDPGGMQVYVDLFRDVDLLIFDAQYSLDDALNRADWGHSSPEMGAELAGRAGVRRLALFHHDPASDDATIYAGLRRAETYLAEKGVDCQVLIAKEGLEIEL